MRCNKGVAHLRRSSSRGDRPNKRCKDHYRRAFPVDCGYFKKAGDLADDEAQTRRQSEVAVEGHTPDLEGLQHSFVEVVEDTLKDEFHQGPAFSVQIS